jgi:hypothetical protein
LSTTRRNGRGSGRTVPIRSTTDGLLTLVPEDFAWRIHQSLQDWTTKVDTKASIVMALETGLSSIILTFSGSVRFPNHPNGALLWAHHGGLVLLFVSIALAGAVVFPQIRHRASARSWQENYVYFGHIRHWQPTELAVELLSGRESRHLHALSTQLVTMSRVVWRKHVALQCSMLCALLGCIAIGVTLIPK